MLNIWGITLILIIITLTVGIFVWLLLTTREAFNKLNSLDSSVKSKLLLIDYYMVFARNLTRNELIKLSSLPDEKIKQLSKIQNITERIKTARVMID
jgi:hypothetical protein